MAKGAEEKPDNVTNSQSFGATVVSDGTGGKKLKLHSLPWYRNQLARFREGENVTIVIHNRRPKRSDAQNRYLWGVFYPLIAEQTGERNLGRLHELFKGLFLTQEVVKVLGRSVRIKKSTAGLNKVEFSQYIMAIENETGVAAPPTENSF